MTRKPRICLDKDQQCRMRREDILSCRTFSFVIVAKAATGAWEEEGRRPPKENPGGAGLELGFLGDREQGGFPTEDFGNDRGAGK